MLVGNKNVKKDSQEINLCRYKNQEGEIIRQEIKMGCIRKMTRYH